ncbi:MAG: hypothetical protein S4CHLAM20_01280 [Chlamydiia bacterium]|nr:hypothetical protein [Chlamydiia bacterium]
MKEKFFVLIFGIASCLHAHTPFLKEQIYTLPVINKIPKIIHQVWVGSKPIPEKYKEYMETWKKLHPDWEYKLWTDSDIEGFDWINREYFDAVSNPGMKSDIWRYEIIYRYGGVYADCDIECKRSIDPIHKRLEFYTGYNGKTSKVIGNHLFASVPGSQFFEQLIDALKKDFKRVCLSTIDCMAIQKLTGPFFLTHFVKSLILQNNNRLEVVFPAEYFQPIDYQSKAKISWRESDNLDICFMVHHNGLSWADE